MKLIVTLLTIWLGQAIGPARVRMSASERPIDIKVSPTICIAPCGFTVTIAIKKDPDNRYVVLEIDGTIFRSTEVRIQGEEGPAIVQEIYKDFPSGEYTIKAVLYNTTREVSRQVRTLIIKGD
jgi:hypothetical protein